MGIITEYPTNLLFKTCPSRLSCIGSRLYHRQPALLPRTTKRRQTLNFTSEGVGPTPNQLETIRPKAQSARVLSFSRNRAALRLHWTAHVCWFVPPFWYRPLHAHDVLSSCWNGPLVMSSFVETTPNNFSHFSCIVFEYILLTGWPPLLPFARIITTILPDLDTGVHSTSSAVYLAPGRIPK